MLLTYSSTVWKVEYILTGKVPQNGLGLIERLKVVETKTIKWTVTVAFEDHSPPLSLPITSGGGRKERTCS